MILRELHPTRRQAHQPFFGVLPCSYREFPENARWTHMALLLKCESQTRPDQRLTVLILDLGKYHDLLVRAWLRVMLLQCWISLRLADIPPTCALHTCAHQDRAHQDRAQSQICARFTRISFIIILPFTFRICRILLPIFYYSRFNPMYIRVYTRLWYSTPKR